MFISPTAGAHYNERFRDKYTFSELISNIRKVGKIDSRKMQGQSAFSRKSSSEHQLINLLYELGFSYFCERKFERIESKFKRQNSSIGLNKNLSISLVAKVERRIMTVKFAIVVNYAFTHHSEQHLHSIIHI